MEGRENPNPLEVPERGDPDRKRALNVLAQRRYRQRTRERIAALEQRAGTIFASSTPIIMPSDRMTMDAVSNETDLWQQSNPGLTINGLHHVHRVSPTITSDTTSTQGMQPTFSVNALDQSTSLDVPGHGNLLFDMAPLPESFDFSQELEDLESSQFTFPDDATMDISVLNVMKAGSNIASLLGCQDTIWDMTSRRTLSQPDPLSEIRLPPNFEPTTAQRMIPHHPLFDILPWPSVRTKLITIFSLPVQARPIIARDPMALMQLVYDLDDSAEGLRTTGFDWRDEMNWEVGQKVFENWWFVLDRDIIRRSNALRERRGARRLLPPVTRSIVQEGVGG